MSEIDYDIEDSYENFVEGLTLDQTLKIQRLLRIDMSDMNLSSEESMKLGLVFRWYQAIRRRSGKAPDLDNLCFHVGNLPVVSSIGHAMRMLDEFEEKKTNVNTDKIMEIKEDTKPEEDVITRFNRLEII